ncbi:tetratricopeptide repeat protein [Roseobacter sp. YSTF-M11]|uniref:Tetratricopeptide repeat protein n=1 Tax=Roseobacter insulae TaxID=2859783 RepID=A0A9X1G014_9RHOB|nr:tetratricopeptide repeat protein [Roseobacter insulae]MBW4710767.1 tetratricopeptide repeat protein [Roseobacter insulae]
MALAACDSDEERAEEFYQRGLELAAEGDEERARIEFRNALKQDATHLDARVYLARLQFKAGALRPAFREFLRVAEQDPENLEAQVKLGEMAFLIQNWEAFERHSDAAIQLASDDPNVRLLDLAKRYRSAVLEEDSAARSSVLAEAEAMEADFPDNGILRQILIDGYLFEEKHAAALEQIEKAIVAAPDRQDLYVTKVQLLNGLNDLDAVETELYRMVETFPDEQSYQVNLLRFLMSRDKGDEAEAFLRDRIAQASEDKVVPTINLIQFLLGTDQRDAAMSELETAIDANPDAHTLRALRASLTFEDGQRDEAIAEMQALVDAQGEDSNPEAFLNIKVALATMLATNGNEVGARRLVEEILAQDGNSVGALKMQARWMIADDNPEGAITAMRTALASSAQDAEAMTIMAEAYKRAGNSALMLDFLSLAVEATNNAPAEALRYAAALRQDDKLLQAEAALIASLRNQPNNVDILLALGNIYLELADTARAQQVADTLKRIGTEQAQTGANTIELALIARESGSGEVLAYLQNLADQDGGNSGARLALVQALVEQGDTDGAQEMINEMVAEEPDNVSFVYFQGLVQASVGDIDAARDTFQSLTEKAPDIALAWLQLARLQTVGTDGTTALETLDRGLQANPDSGNILWAKATLLQEKNDIDGAITIYEDLYAKNSASIVVANNLASLLATFRRDEESLARAQTISRRLQDTDVPAFQDTYGWIQHRVGNSEEALKYLEPAARALVDDATVQYHLGVVYEALGRRDEALVQMHRAMDKIGPLGSGALSEEVRSKIAALEAAADN